VNIHVHVLYMYRVVGVNTFLGAHSRATLEGHLLVSQELPGTRMSATYSCTPLEEIDLRSLKPSRFLDGNGMLPYRDGDGAVNVHLVRHSMLQVTEGLVAVDAQTEEKLRRWLRHAERWVENQRETHNAAATSAVAPTAPTEHPVVPAAHLVAPIPTAQPAEGSMPTAQPAEGSVPTAQPAEGSVPTAQPAEAAATAASGAKAEGKKPPACPICAGSSKTLGGWGHIDAEHPLPEYRYRCLASSCAHTWHAPKHTLSDVERQAFLARAPARDMESESAPPRKKHAKARPPHIQRLHAFVQTKILSQQAGAEPGSSCLTAKRDDWRAWADEFNATSEEAVTWEHVRSQWRGISGNMPVSKKHGKRPDATLAAPDADL
jgi:hypothetical protein